MRENYNDVQDGFNILHKVLAQFVGKALRTKLGKDWWTEVLSMVNDPNHKLPESGEFQELVGSLDRLQCLSLIDCCWNRCFRQIMNDKRSSRNLVIQLIGVRNDAAHMGCNLSVEQIEAERALQAMYLLCGDIKLCSGIILDREMIKESEEKIHEIYLRVRARATDVRPVVYEGIAQPDPASGSKTAFKVNLLDLVGTDAVQKTDLTRKITYGGKTVTYPVYRVSLDKLYYNDQNDRIATRISKYESENGKNALFGIDRETYNNIIEGFICESNPEAIERTQNNISLVGQSIPGVTLADGRVVDGNRRFTCLRRIQRETAGQCFFETAIMETDIREDKKQIKLLELAIQHGEEKKVDYDPVDFAMGTYRDVVQTRLLTADEYAASANESLADVKKRIAIAEIIYEFLEYINMPGQFHTVREYGCYDLFKEMLPQLKGLDPDDRKQLKTIAFNNIIMKAVPDQRQFMRDIKKLIKADAYHRYFSEQKEIAEKIFEKLESTDVSSKADIDCFSEDNSAISDNLRTSMENAMLRYRSQYLTSLPADNIAACIELIAEIDPVLFERLSGDKRNSLKTSLDDLSGEIEKLKKLL